MDASRWMMPTGDCRFQPFDCVWEDVCEYMLLLPAWSMGAPSVEGNGDKIMNLDTEKTGMWTSHLYCSKL
jgi:hypothetical protein